jgi:hypothetical protein
MRLAVNKMVLFLLFLIVLLAVIILLFGVGKPIGEQIVLQNQIRQCCMAFRGNNCENPADIFCDGETLDVLMKKLNMEEWQVESICNCE